MTTAVKEDLKVIELLNQMCDGEWHFNKFPQGKVVRITKEIDQFRCFTLGLNVGGSDSVFGQARVSEMPVNVRLALGLGNANPNSIWSVYYILSKGEGQSSTGTKNLLAIFPHSYNLSKDVVVVELGCSHDFRSVEVGRCAYVHTCQICGFEQFCDSSD